MGAATMLRSGKHLYYESNSVFMGRSPSRTKDKAHGGCAVTDLFRILGKAHVLDILYALTKDGAGPLRFVDIQKRLSLSPNTLSERLKDLVEAGLVTRTAYNEIPPRVDYQATRKAADLSAVFDNLQTWAARYSLKPEPDGPLVVA